MDSGKIFRKRLILGTLAAAVSVMAVKCALPGKGDYIGEFDMSHYCLEQRSGYHICGNSAYGCNGDKLQPGRSVAVPASVIKKYPVGTKVLAVYPDGSSDNLVIQDTGSALERLHRIDMPVETHEEAMRLGVIKNVKLYKMR